MSCSTRIQPDAMQSDSPNDTFILLGIKHAEQDIIALYKYGEVNNLNVLLQAPSKYLRLTGGLPDRGLFRKSTFSAGLQTFSSTQFEA